MVTSSKFPAPSFLYKIAVSSAKCVLKISRWPSRLTSPTPTPIPACSMPSSLSAAPLAKPTSLNVPSLLLRNNRLGVESHAT